MLLCVSVCKLYIYVCLRVQSKAYSFLARCHVIGCMNLVLKIYYSLLLEKSRTGYYKPALVFRSFQTILSTCFWVLNHSLLIRIIYKSANFDTKFYILFRSLQFHIYFFISDNISLGFGIFLTFLFVSPYLNSSFLKTYFKCTK
jgi:hypothetical protein